jgi:hypothetical protein
VVRCFPTLSIVIVCKHVLMLSLNTAHVVLSNNQLILDHSKLASFRVRMIFVFKQYTITLIFAVYPFRVYLLEGKSRLLNREDHMGRFDCICKATPWPDTHIFELPTRSVLLRYLIKNNLFFVFFLCFFFVRCCQIIKRKTWLSTTVGAVFREYA